MLDLVRGGFFVQAMHYPAAAKEIYQGMKLSFTWSNRKSILDGTSAPMTAAHSELLPSSSKTRA